MNSPLPENGRFPMLQHAAAAPIHRLNGHSCQWLIPEHETLDQTQALLFALAQVVECRDQNTFEHCERLALMSLAMGMTLSLDEFSLSALYRGGYLHDIGKVGIPDAILLKPGKLTPQEWGVMRTHPEQGEQICRHLSSLAPVLPIIRHHHERWDGSGYPDGLRGDRIPLLARIVQVADIFDALTNPRPYKQPFTADQAIHMIEEETARGWRDPDVVTAFLRLPVAGIDRIADYIRNSQQGTDTIQTSIANLSQIFH
jgi:putative two-component system response regulator